MLKSKDSFCTIHFSCFSFCFLGYIWLSFPIFTGQAPPLQTHTSCTSSSSSTASCTSEGLHRLMHLHLGLIHFALARLGQPMEGHVGHPMVVDEGCSYH